ncbi:MAG: mechanosensitive ion channel [Cyclobacteriaceae bacterium]|nr:mechanosensitive ion channel [Cyclobacteriaceae bacterium]
MGISFQFLRFIENRIQGVFKKAFYLFWLVSLSFGYASGKEELSDTSRLALENPYQAVYTHLEYLSENNFHPEIASQAFIQEGVTPQKAKSAALKMKQILNGEGIYIEMDLIPRNPDFLDSASNRNRYILTSSYPEIYLIKSGNKWIYSKASIDHIDRIHKRVFPFGSDKLLEILPRLGQTRILGLHTWQIFGILIIIVLSFIVHMIFSLLFEKIIIVLLNRYGYREIVHGLIKPIAKPISYLVIFPILIILVPVLQLPVLLAKYIILALKALWPVFLTIVFYKLVDVFGEYMFKVAKRTESTLDDQLVPLIRKILKTFVIVIGVMFVLINLEISIIPFITGLSIGGLAFALAAQDTIKNFFGSLMIFIDKPFQVGQWITSGDIDGEVEEVGLRSTRVRTFRNSLIYVPNGILADRTIDNHGMRTYRRFYTTLAITYDTPPRLIEVFLEGLKRIVEEHSHTRKDKYHIFLNDFGGSSLNIMFYIFFNAPNWALELQYRHEIILKILGLAEKLNVRFAFPTSTLHMETFPDKQSLTPEYRENGDQMREKMMNYFGKDQKPTL